VTPIFHLSLSVSDLEASCAFYEEVLGARRGRTTPHWADLWLFGAQLTAYQRPSAVTPSPYREAQHFGATLDWPEWVQRDAALQADAPAAVVQRVLDAERGSAKLVLRDPDGYLIELKAYRDVATLQRPQP